MVVLCAGPSTSGLEPRNSRWSQVSGFRMLWRFQREAAPPSSQSCLVLVIAELSQEHVGRLFQQP